MSAKLPYAVELFLRQVADGGPPLTAGEARRLLDRVDGLTNLEKAKAWTAEIAALKATQKALNAAFAQRDLDGGYRAAFIHPLWVEAEAEIKGLEERLVGLI